MRVLVTGGAGFQGSHLVEHLIERGHEVSVLNTYSGEAEYRLASMSAEPRVVWGSVTDHGVVEKMVREQDVTIHTAARINVDQSLREPEAFIDVNIKGTQNVLEAVKDAGNRLVFASSCEVYGDTVEPVAEGAELRPRSPYAASKVAADRLCYAYHVAFGVNVIIVRPSNVFGRRQKKGVTGAVIPRFVEQALSGHPLTLYGDGEQTREYTHVSDIVEAYVALAERDDLAGETFNIGSGDTPTIRSIVDFIAGELGGTVEQQPGRVGEISRVALDSTKIRALGVTTKIEFWDGLRQYIEWRKLIG